VTLDVVETERRLAVILAADAANYGSLMQQDEEGTYRELHAILHRVFKPTIARHRGRIAKTAGDGLIAEFANLVEAVRCAVEVQQAISQASGAEGSRLQFRVGINLGDVLVENGDMFGDGVNIAARLERLAEPGGVLISAAVYEHVQGRVPYRFLDLGERGGKGGERPIHVYRIDWNAGPGGKDGAASRPPTGADPQGRPRLAVLHFANLSDDTDSEYFSHGLTEDIIRLLGRHRWLDVLSRHSTLIFRRPDVNPYEVRAALGARYVVQGSVRVHKEHVRVTVELVETEAGRQLWSEAYDLGLVDIFDVQDAIAQQIAAVIEPEVGRVEEHLAARKPPESLHAWDCYQRGCWHLWSFTQPGFAEATALFRRAIRIEPGLARAHAGLAYVYLQTAFYSRPEERPALIDAALASARSAVTLDDRDSHCHYVLGRILCLLRRMEESIAELEKTIALNPSYAQGYFGLAFTFVWCRREEEAIALLERAVELSPRDPHLWTFHHIRALAHFSLGELDGAEFFAREAIRQPNATYFAYTTLVATLGLAGRKDEAQAALRQLWEKEPAYSLAFARSDFFYCVNEDLLERFLEGLRLAGVPEQSTEVA